MEVGIIDTSTDFHGYKIPESVIHTALAAPRSHPPDENIIVLLPDVIVMDAKARHLEM